MDTFHFVIGVLLYNLVFSMLSYLVETLIHSLHHEGLRKLNQTPDSVNVCPNKCIRKKSERHFLCLLRSCDEY